MHARWLGKMKSTESDVCYFEVDAVFNRELYLTSGYGPVRDAILTCARKLTRVSLTYRTEPTTNQWKTKLKGKKRICSEVSVNSPEESVESALKKKREATVGRICKNGRF